MVFVLDHANFIAPFTTSIQDPISGTVEAIYATNDQSWQRKSRTHAIWMSQVRAGEPIKFARTDLGKYNS